MSEDEQKTWLSVLLAIWGMVLFLFVTATFAPEGAPTVALSVGLFVLTGVYLFALLLRNVYLAGKKQGAKRG